MVFRQVEPDRLSHGGPQPSRSHAQHVRNLCGPPGPRFPGNIFRVTIVVLFSRAPLSWLRNLCYDCYNDKQRWFRSAGLSASHIQKYNQTNNQTTLLVFIASQIVRIFGKFPALRRIIMSLTACTTPMIGAFSILVIFQCLCKWILHVPLHGACYSSNC